MILYATDLEGPLSKNDNAAELSDYFIGGGFFRIVSKFDDFLADVEKREGYKAGNTLALIAPFLRAYGATNEAIEDHSRKNILLVPGAKETIQCIKNMRIPFFLISTSYEPYVRALCELTDFDFKHAYCTALDMDRYPVNREADALKGIAKNISRMEMPEWPDDATSIEDLRFKHRITIKQLKRIFFEVLPDMRLGKLMEEINPIGGYEKANALRECIRNSGVDPNKAMYTGDSITDVQAYQEVKNNDGLAISFNGNSYAVGEADVAIMSPHTLPSSIIAEVFLRKGKEHVFTLAYNWDEVILMKVLGDCGVSDSLANQLYDMKEQPRVVLLTDDNRSQIAEESSAFRKKVRGEKIGALG